MPFGFLSSKHLILNYLTLYFFYLQCTWWRIFHKRVVHTKLYIYVFVPWLSH